MLQYRNPIVFFPNDNVNSKQNIISSDAVNTAGHAVNALTGLLIDFIYNLDIANRIWIDLYIKGGTLLWEIQNMRYKEE